MSFGAHCHLSVGPVCLAPAWHWKIFFYLAHVDSISRVHPSLLRCQLRGLSGDERGVRRRWVKILSFREWIWDQNQGLGFDLLKHLLGFHVAG